jgi:hypothetical protein
MGKHEKLLIQILRGASDANISFDGLCGLLRHLGFAERTSGSHHIFTREGVEEILNVQPGLEGQGLSGQTGSRRHLEVQARGAGR